MSEGVKVGDMLWFMPFRNSREGWQSKKVVDETRYSWIAGESREQSKINKKTMLENEGKWGNQRWHTEQEKDDLIWVWKYRHKIISAASVCGDVAALRQIAALIGYQLEESK